MPRNDEWIIADDGFDPRPVIFQAEQKALVSITEMRNVDHHGVDVVKPIANGNAAPVDDKPDAVNTFQGDVCIAWTSKQGIPCFGRIEVIRINRPTELCGSPV